MLVRLPNGRRIWRLFSLFCWFVSCWSTPRFARAETLQAAVGSRSFTLPGARVACAPPGGGWAIDPASQGHGLRAPTSSDAIGKAVSLRVAASPALCATESSTLDLVATARAPSIESSSVVLLL